MTPSWVAASPTPSASRMIATIRSASRLELGPEAAHLGRPRLQHRVAERPDLGERRGAALARLGVELGDCVVAGALGAQRLLLADGGVSRIAHPDRV